MPPRNVSSTRANTTASTSHTHGQTSTSMPRSSTPLASHEKLRTRVASDRSASGVRRQDAPLLALDDDEMGRTVGGDDLEAGEAAMAVLVPPALVEGPRAGPAGDRLRRSSCRSPASPAARSARRARRRRRGDPLVGDDGSEAVTRAHPPASRTSAGDGAGRAPAMARPAPHRGGDASGRPCRRRR